MAVHTIRSYAFTAVLMLVITLFSAASFRTEVQQRTQDIIAAKQAAVIDEQCHVRADGAKAHNALVDELMASVQSSTAISDAGLVDRLRRYEAARVTVTDCEANR